MGGSSSMTRINGPSPVTLRRLLATPSGARLLGQVGGLSAPQGKVSVKTAPDRSERLPAVIVPPSASTKPRQTASPSPVPGGLRSPGRATRWNLANTRSSSAFGIPGPSSRTLKHDAARLPLRRSTRSSRRARTWTALSSRLTSTCSSNTASSSQHRQVGLDVEFDPVLDRARGSQRSSAAPIASPRSIISRFEFDARPTPAG